jgi:actin-like ATPase involved in cell morphogenesis/outer membrane biosynthesis protein TonB
VDRIAPVIGIDFGTTNSKMACYNPKTNQAQIIKNREGEDETPSVVYFGEQQTLVGTPALDMLAYEEERDRVILSIKRELVTTPRLALPDKTLKPVEVVAEILRKLKADAETLHFHQEVAHAVVTYPASFGPVEREKICEAARLAGFAEVDMLEEPVAAALAYTRMGPTVGKSVLVYDLGGGTFDLAVLACEEDGAFRLALEPQGIKRCGGDDFDHAIYEHCDKIAQQNLGRSVSLTDKRDLHFLRECRQRKENLSSAERHKFKSYLEPDAVLFQYVLERATLERLIYATVEQTVRKTSALLTQASTTGQTVDTLVLIGGSSRIPLVRQILGESLFLEPLQWQYQDVAVALGAVYYAYEQAENSGLESGTNGAEIPLTTTPTGLAMLTAHQVALATYRQALARAWTNKKISQTKVDHLKILAKGLALSKEDTAQIERETLGKRKESILDQQRQLQYRKAVSAAWVNKKLDQEKVQQLTDLAKKLHLSKTKIGKIERSVMGNLKEALLLHQQADSSQPAPPPRPTGSPQPAPPPRPTTGSPQPAPPPRPTTGSPQPAPPPRPTGSPQPAPPPRPTTGSPQPAPPPRPTLLFSSSASSQTSGRSRDKKVPSTSQTQSRKAAFLDILRKFPHIFVYPAIPESKLINARRACNIPDDEPILGLIDCTVFGSARNCVLFGAHGVYYRELWTPPGKLLYTDFPGCVFKNKGSVVTVSNGQKFSLSGSHVSAATARTILNEIKQVILQ